ncbi:MAG: hypothetical protein ABWX94_01975 [Candidatus Saccharimonadales bacterium]
MLPVGFIIIAVMLRLWSGASYFKATLNGTAQPSIVSWSFWSLTALIAFVVQLSRGSGPEAFVTLAIGLSPIAVCVAALYKGAYRTSLQKSDKWCIALTSLGIMLWIISKNPLMALYMSILADIFSSIPTILKSYRKPQSEHPAAYVLSVISMGITLLTVTNWQITNWLFTAYILAINCTYLFTIFILSKLRRDNRREVVTA